MEPSIKTTVEYVHMYNLSSKAIKCYNYTYVYGDTSYTINVQVHAVCTHMLYKFVQRFRQLQCTM